ncbi:DUF4136 domain-containing protein [Pseudomonas aeruginosa]
MIRRILLLGLLLSLAACETTQLDRDFDSSRDFAAYRSWSWSQPAFEYRPDDPRIKSDLTEQRIREAVAQQLDQRGLRPAQGNARSDVTVRAYLIVDDRQDQITTNYGGGYWGGYWRILGRPGDGRDAHRELQGCHPPGRPVRRQGRQLVWRGSGEQIMRTSPPSPAEREQAIRETVQKVMSQYPPR